MIESWKCVALGNQPLVDDKNFFKLYQSADPNVILIAASQPRLAKNIVTNRWEASIYLVRDPANNQLTGGGLTFAVQTGAPGDPLQLQDFEKTWLPMVQGQGGPRSPAFLGLTVRKSKANLNIFPELGTWLSASNEADIGTPGDIAVFDVQLTAKGAALVYETLAQQKAMVLGGGLKIDYQFLEVLPSASVHVTVHGQQLYHYFETQLDAGGGFLFGNSAQIDTSWKSSHDVGAIEITYTNQPPAGTDTNKLVATFVDQAGHLLFDQIFAPVADPKLEKPGTLHNLLGGATFQLNWKNVNEAVDLSLDIAFEGTDWLQGDMSVPIASLLGALDQTYVQVVRQQVEVPVHLELHGSPYVDDAVLTAEVTADGNPTNAHILHSTGSVLGVLDYSVDAFDPSTVATSWSLDVAYNNTDGWDTTKVKGAGTGVAGASWVLKSGAWIRTMMITVRIFGPDDKNSATSMDTLDVNLTLSSTALGQQVSNGGTLGVGQPLHILWPIAPGKTDDIQMLLTAGGVVNGQVVNLDWTPVPTPLTDLSLIVRNGTISFLQHAPPVVQAGLRGHVERSLLPRTAFAHSPSGRIAKPSVRGDWVVSWPPLRNSVDVRSVEAVR